MSTATNKNKASRKPYNTTIRNAARAIIIKDRKLLVITMRDPKGEYYILPGGGQRHGETLTETLLRECREEIGCDIDVGELLYVREYIGKNHTFADRHRYFHQFEVVFRAEIKDDQCPCPGKETDRFQTGVEWLPVDQLQEFRFYPDSIKQFFKDGEISVHPLYLGDMN